MEIQMVYTIQQNKYIACESHIKTILQLVPLQQKKKIQTGYGCTHTDLQVQYYQ